MIVQYKRGESSNNASGEFFKIGLIEVFPSLVDHPDTDEINRILWQSARNGFFHSGMTKDRIYIRDSQDPIQFENGKVYIDRHRFPECIYSHFDEYITSLRRPDSQELINNFNVVWESVNQHKFYPLSTDS